MIFVSQYVISRITLVANVTIGNLEILYFVKMCPIFDGSDLADYEKYEKII